MPTEPQRYVLVDAAVQERIGAWLSAALDDPKVCAEMKADIEAWFATPIAADDPAEVERVAIGLFESNPGRNKALRWEHATVPKKHYRTQALAVLRLFTPERP